jgi:hypothetical protein
MKANFVVCSYLVLFLFIGCAQMENKMNSVPPGSQQSQMFEKKITKTVSCNYLLFLPQEYGKKRQRWP